jgi:hypothetical protein
MSVRFKLNPELGDGEHYTIMDNWQDVVDIVANWLIDGKDAGYAENPASIEIVNMTDAEVAALEEV